MTKIIPVIHYQDDEQAQRNARVAAEIGCHGVFLIQMNGVNAPLLPVANRIKDEHPGLRVGVNFLGFNAEIALTLNVDKELDMTWTDEQVTHSNLPSSTQASHITEMLQANQGHEMFVGVAFKHQAHEPDPIRAAMLAIECGMIPTTSGVATGVAADVIGLATLRQGIGPEAPLAIASGITPENAGAYAPYLSHILVATGVSADFHNLDRAKLEALLRATS